MLILIAILLIFIAVSTAVTATCFVLFYRRLSGVNLLEMNMLLSAMKVKIADRARMVEKIMRSR